MYSLYLTCRPEQTEQICFDLWEAGTVGIREEDASSGLVRLIAGFEDSTNRDAMASAFTQFSPEWEREADIDWVAATEQAWPARLIGTRLFLAPVWNKEATPDGRARVIHNPGLASGTGEHPCTQLALEQLERHVARDSVMVDVGTGSGILSIAALRLGARMAAALDRDAASLETARENFELNGYTGMMSVGSADCLRPGCADVVAANISGTVLLSLADDLLRLVRPGGTLIITGFPEPELSVLQSAFGEGSVSAINEWRCLTLSL